MMISRDTCLVNVEEINLGRSYVELSSHSSGLLEIEPPGVVVNVTGAMKRQSLISFFLSFCLFVRNHSNLDCWSVSWPYWIKVAAISLISTTTTTTTTSSSSSSSNNGIGGSSRTVTLSAATAAPVLVAATVAPVIVVAKEPLIVAIATVLATVVMFDYERTLTVHNWRQCWIVDVAVVAFSYRSPQLPPGAYNTDLLNRHYRRY